MGYTARKIKNNIYIYHESYKPRTQKIVPRDNYIHLGFSNSMSLEEAKIRCKELNIEDQIERTNIKKTQTLERIRKQKLSYVAFLPHTRVERFISELEADYSDNPERLNNVKKLWSSASKIITTLKLDFTKFFDNRNLVYNYFKNEAYSPDYIKKLIWIINKWGEFSARQVSAYYKDIPKLPSTAKQIILDKRQGKDDIKRAADLITFKELKNLRTSFKNQELEMQWNWMFVAFSFGLRPTECDWLLSQPHTPIEYDKQNKCQVLKIYQSKLTSVDHKDRFKVIPVYLENQKEALKLIESKNFKRPLNKTLKRIFDHNVQTYSPRKSFTDFMLENKFQLEDISIFLGHRSIDMTWRHYKGRTKFNLPKRKAA